MGEEEGKGKGKKTKVSSSSYSLLQASPSLHLPQPLRTFHRAPPISIQLEKEGRRAHLLHHGSQLPQHDPESLTSASRARLDGSLLSSSTLAALADDVLLESELGDLSLVEVGERDVDSVNEVLSFARSLTTSSSGESSSSELEKAIMKQKRGSARLLRRARGINSRAWTYSSSSKHLREQVRSVHSSSSTSVRESGLSSLVVAAITKVRDLVSISYDLEGETSSKERKKDVHLPLLRVGENLVAVWLKAERERRRTIESARASSLLPGHVAFWYPYPHRVWQSSESAGRPS